MDDEEAETVEGVEIPGHFAPEIEPEKHPDLVGFVGDLVEESVVEDHALAVLPEIALTLLGQAAVSARVVGGVGLDPHPAILVPVAR